MGPVRAVIAAAAVLAAVLTTTPAAAAGPPAARATGIAIGTHNTHHGDASFEPFAGVIGWQEVDDPAARDKLRTRLGDGYATYFPPDGPAKAVPISWRVDRFAKVGGGSVRTHDGEAGVTPARYVNWVVLEVRGTTTRFIVVNTHFISGAWSGHPERQARWNRHYQVLHDRVARLRAAHPAKPLFVLGDVNRARAMTLPAPVRYVPVAGVDGVPIDHIYAPSDVSHGEVSRRPRWGSDHHAYSLHATI